MIPTCSKIWSWPSRLWAKSYCPTTSRSSQGPWTKSEIAWAKVMIYKWKGAGSTVSYSLPKRPWRWSQLLRRRAPKLRGCLNKSFTTRERRSMMRITHCRPKRQCHTRLGTWWRRRLTLNFTAICWYRRMISKGLRSIWPSFVTSSSVNKGSQKLLWGSSHF